MILYEVVGRNENNPAYQAMEVSNGIRHYGFLRSVVEAALSVNRPFLSQTVIKAINYHAIACLHPTAGEYRPCNVSVGGYAPPEPHRIITLMDDFVNEVNRYWDENDGVVLAAYVLWKLNQVHPFINGNGRTARAACYFVLCVKSGAWLPGKVILPELIRKSENREVYYKALEHADKEAANLNVALSPLITLLNRLLEEQISSA